MKRLTPWILVVMLMLSLAGCGGSGGAGETAAVSGAVQSAASAPAASQPAPAEEAAETDEGGTMPQAEQKPEAAAPADREEPAPASGETPSPEGGDSVQRTCTLEIRCDTILDNWEQLDEGKRDIVPSDGVLLSTRTVAFDEGDSVFDVLLRETRAAKLHMEYVDTPLYGSAYIEGIGNLYEFDCGPLSGWVYAVNGVFPNYGASQYALSDGDSVVWRYTCDLGADVGGANGAW